MRYPVSPIQDIPFLTGRTLRVVDQRVVGHIGHSWCQGGFHFTQQKIPRKFCVDICSGRVSSLWSQEGGYLEGYWGLLTEYMDTWVILVIMNDLGRPESFMAASLFQLRYKGVTKWFGQTDRNSEIFIWMSQMHNKKANFLFQLITIFHGFGTQQDVFGQLQIRYIILLLVGTNLYWRIFRYFQGTLMAGQVYPFTNEVLGLMEIEFYCG